MSKDRYRRIHNWDSWQTYRSDRGRPPWIKVHRCIFQNADFIRLTDAQFGQLVKLWILAADRDGDILDDADVLKKLCFMDSDLDLQVFEDLGFIDPDANMTPTWRQPDANVASGVLIARAAESSRWAAGSTIALASAATSWCGPTRWAR